MEWLLVVFADVVFSGFLSAFFPFSPDDGERSRFAGGSLVMRPLTQGRRGSKPRRERGDYSIAHLRRRAREPNEKDPTIILPY